LKHYIYYYQLANIIMNNLGGIINNTWEHVTTLFRGTVDSLRIDPQVSIPCEVILSEDEFAPVANVQVDTWVSENHLIWYLCAKLSESGLYPNWTAVFEAYYRVTYNGYQIRLSWARGPERFLLYFQPPPIQLAVFSYTPAGGNVDDTVNFSIRSTPPTTRPNRDLVNLMNYIHGGEFDIQNGRFHVALYEFGMDGISEGGTPKTPATPAYSGITPRSAPTPTPSPPPPYTPPPPYSSITRSPSTPAPYVTPSPPPFSEIT
jgi:hypothetical protein